MSRHQWVVAVTCLIFPAFATAVPLIDDKDTLECEPILKPMKIQQNSAHLATRCYKAIDTLQCLPGLTLMVDRSGGHDLCVNLSGAAVGTPTCNPKKKFEYIQQIIQRRFLPVTTKEGTSSQWVDIPFSSRRMRAKLAQHIPWLSRSRRLRLFVIDEDIGHETKRSFQPESPTSATSSATPTQALMYELEMLGNIFREQI